MKLLCHPSKLSGNPAVGVIRDQPPVPPYLIVDFQEHTAHEPVHWPQIMFLGSREPILTLRQLARPGPTPAPVVIVDRSGCVTASGETGRCTATGKACAPASRARRVGRCTLRATRNRLRRPVEPRSGRTSSVGAVAYTSHVARGRRRASLAIAISFGRMSRRPGCRTRRPRTAPSRLPTRRDRARSRTRRRDQPRLPSRRRGAPVTGQR
jgi:hypothetical protein